MLARALTSHGTIEDACDALLEADRLIAKAVHIVGAADVEGTSGLPIEIVLSLRARRTGSDARFITHAASVLRSMPATDAAFMRGDVSWAQVRAIVGAVRPLDAAGRLSVDELIGRWVEGSSTLDPDELVARVDDAVGRARGSAHRARGPSDRPRLLGRPGTP